jgi:hypothetical protein
MAMDQFSSLQWRWTESMSPLLNENSLCSCQHLKHVDTFTPTPSQYSYHRSKTETQKKTLKQFCLPSAFKQPPATDSDRAKEFLRAIGMLIATDMSPFLVVENKGFQHLMKVLNTLRNSHSCTHFSKRVVPALYKQAKDKVGNELANIPCVVLITGGWTSRATDSYLTVSPHHITRSGK